MRLLVFSLLVSFTLALPTGKDESARNLAKHEESHHYDAESKGEDMMAEASSLSDVELVAGDEEEDDEVEGDSRHDSQHFFPSFAPLFSSPPLGHSRPHVFDHDSPPRTSTFAEPPYRFRSLYNEAESERVLGSGNFGVIKGGTYYGASGDDSQEYDSTYYRGGNNGHGRPPYYRGNPQPAYRHGGDFFAGFRDFADITTPAKPAYSQYYVVYANRNATDASPHPGPKNIIEQLALLDKPEKLSKKKLKLSLHKEKMHKVEQKKKNKSPKEAYEPLLALS